MKREDAKQAGGGSAPRLSVEAGLWSVRPWMAAAWPLFSSREGVVSRQAIDSQLRTGTDKGNPTF